MQLCSLTCPFLFIYLLLLLVDSNLLHMELNNSFNFFYNITNIIFFSILVILNPWLSYAEFLSNFIKELSTISYHLVYAQLPLNWSSRFLCALQHSGCLVLNLLHFHMQTHLNYLTRPFIWSKECRSPLRS